MFSHDHYKDVQAAMVEYMQKLKVKALSRRLAEQEVKMGNNQDTQNVDASDCGSQMS